jgi:hypothetical protein
LRRNVAGNDSHPAFCQVARVYACPASDLKRTVSWTKYSRHLAPHGCALSSTDLGGSESLVVSGRDRIKWCGINLLCDGHALGLNFGESGLQTSARLGNPAAQRGKNRIVGIGLVP